jgi:hypothetical protein
MRYLMTTKPTDTAPDENLYVEMGKFVEELTAAGVLLATGGLEPGGVRVSSCGDEVTVTDGPFTESKEAVAGFALVEVGSKEEAMSSLGASASSSATARAWSSRSSGPDPPRGPVPVPHPTAAPVQSTAPGCVRPGAVLSSSP